MDVFEQRPDVEQTGFELRPAVEEPTPPISTPVASAFAQIVGIAFRSPSVDLQAVEQEFANSGRSSTWDRYKTLSENVTNEQSAIRLAERLRAEKNRLGIADAPDAYDPKNPFFSQVINDEIERNKVYSQNPEAVEYVRHMLELPLPEEADAEQKAVRIETQQNELDVVRSAFMQGKDMDSVLKESMGPEYTDSFLENLSGGIAEFFGIPAFARSAALNKTFELNAGWGVFLPGEVYKRLRKDIIRMTPEAQLGVLNKFRETVKTNPAFFTDFSKFRGYQDLMSDEFLLGRSAEAGQDLWTTMLPWADVTGIPSIGAGMVRLAARPMTMAASPLLKAALRANKEQAVIELTEALASGAGKSAIKYNIEPAVVGLTQLPKLEMFVKNAVEDVPQILQKDIDRLRIQQDELDSGLRQLDASIVSPVEKVSRAERELAKLETTNSSVLLPGKSSIAPFIDGTGAQVAVMIGKSSTAGFRKLSTTIQRAEDLRASGQRVQIWYKDGEVLKPLGNPALSYEENLAAIGKITDKNSPSGDFYIKVFDEVTYSPLDRMASGDTSLLTGNSLGRAVRYLTTPSAYMPTKTYKSYLRRFGAENYITSTLDNMVAPLFKLNNASRARVSDAMEWSANFARKEKRAPTMKEVQDQYGNMLSVDEVRGLYLARAYYDTLYGVANRHYYNNLIRAGAKSIQAKGSAIAYHGVPTARDELGKAGRRFYNPQTNAIEGFTEGELDAIYARGGAVLRSELTVAPEAAKEWTNYIIYDPRVAKDWVYKALNKNPLKYIPGYYTRMYQQPIMIKRLVPSAMLNGREQEYKAAVRMADSHKEADEWIKQQKDLHPEYKYEKVDTQRISDLDRSAADLEMMQVEGRIFYDDRNVAQLYDVSGKPAELESPINAISRTARLIARHTAMEDISQAMLRSWELDFKELVGTLKIDLSRMPAPKIIEELDNAVNKGLPKSLEALESYRYIQMMRGLGPQEMAIQQGGRNAMIAAGEFVYNSLKGTAGAEFGKYAARNSWRISPAMGAKMYTFFDFIITRPTRQLVLQSSQHFMLQALDPTYVGRWQLDATVLLQGAKVRGKAYKGLGDIGEFAINRNAALMRLSQDQYLELLKRFDNSGLMQTVNIRALGGGEISPEAAHTFANPYVNALDTAGAVLTARPVRRRMERWGFDLGEQLNLSASYTLALRQTMKKLGKKDLLKLTDTEWDEVATLAADYGMAMTRPNSAAYQYGLLSLPLQFMQFSHKVFLTMLRGVPGLGKYGNKAFTPWEARKIIAGQIALFGGAGFGIKPEVKKLAAEMGITDPLAVDIISGGMLDWLLDKSLQAITGDEKVDLQFDTFLAPGANTVNLFRQFIEIAMENSLEEAFFGPSEASFSRIWKAGQMARTLMNVPDDVSWSEDKVSAILDAVASGMFAGYSDWAKARLAARVGYWLAENGEISGIEARMTDLVAKGFFGLNSQEMEDTWRIPAGFNEEDATPPGARKKVGSDAKEYYTQIRAIANRYGDPADTDEKLYMLASMHQSITAGMNGLEREAFWGELQNLASADKGRKDSLTEAIANRIRQGRGTPKEWMLADVANSNMNARDKELAIKLIEQQLQLAETTVPVFEKMEQYQTDKLRKRMNAN